MPWSRTVLMISPLTLASILQLTAQEPDCKINLRAGI